MFEKPKEVTGMDCAFGPRNGLDVEKDLPPIKPIKQGISLSLALRHLGACLSSWEPKHEHKTAGVAYLMSLWFEDLP